MVNCKVVIVSCLFSMKISSKADVDGYCKRPHYPDQLDLPDVHHQRNVKLRWKDC